MLKPTLEVADIFRLYANQYIQRYAPPIDHLKVISAIIACRTAKLGGHVETCSAGCGYQRITYNSCLNRHCPKCQFTKAANWIEDRKDELLPVPYFHVVFTLPTSKLLPVILPNKKTFYNLMFQCVSETLKELGLDPKWLGAKIGAICILHTWTQKLAFHPHIHCIVPAGGLSIAGNQWIPFSNPDFFVPFAVLAKLFQFKLLAGLKALNKKHQLNFFDNDHLLHHPSAFNQFCQSFYNQKWIAYAKPSFNGPSSVIQYLGQYVHKIAISNYRLIKLENDRVFFSYQDRANGNLKKITSLHVFDFMKLFLQHVLPYHFVKIRSYGFLSNRSKQKSLIQARALLSHPKNEETMKIPIDSPSSKKNRNQCPNCYNGFLIKLPLFPFLPKIRPP